MTAEQTYQLLPRFSREPEKNDEFDEEYLISSSKSSTSLSSDETRIPHRVLLKGVKEHVEEHFDRPELVRDCILGLSDGLTVPFALAAGLSSLGDSRIVIYGCLAGNYFLGTTISQCKSLIIYKPIIELVSGAISMGLGGYLAAKSEADHYHTEREREGKKKIYCLFVVQIY